MMFEIQRRYEYKLSLRVHEAGGVVERVRIQRGVAKVDGFTVRAGRVGPVEICKVGEPVRVGIFLVVVPACFGKSGRHVDDRLSWGEERMADGGVFRPIDRTVKCK